VLCKNLQHCRKQLPDLSFGSDLEFVSGSEERRLVRNLYRTADCVISAPGGFLHDHYDIQGRLAGFETAIEFGTPLILFAQSVGPFWKAESRRRVPEVLNHVARICVRDEISVQHLEGCGVDPGKIIRTADAAFLWRKLAPDLLQADHRAANLVGMCFRAWPLGDEARMQRTIAKAEKLCRHILGDEDRTILFLSTCQGIAGYADDSKLALAIVERLPAALRNRCRVDRRRYAPRELMRALAECQAFIGMRLHAALLAMLAGVPSAGLAYESKTPEIFGQLGLEEYQTSFETGVEQWIGCFDHLWRNVSDVRAGLAEKLDKASARARKTLDVVAAEMRDGGGGDWTELMEPYHRAPQSEPTIYEIRAAVPRGSRIVLADQEEIRGAFPELARPLPFLERAGEYWGPPPDDATAIAEIERLRSTGAEFLIFVPGTYWWLDHYVEFARHLMQRAPLIVDTERLKVFNLRSGEDN
jgi:polysaccharide pyruvyl transferase WcaK-like protein